MSDYPNKADFEALQQKLQSLQDSTMDYIMGLTSRCDSFDTEIQEIDANAQQLRDSVLFVFRQRKKKSSLLKSELSLLKAVPASNTSRSFSPAVMLCRNMVRASTPITTTVTVRLQALRKAIPISAVQRMTMLCTSISLISAGQEQYLCFA